LSGAESAAAKLGRTSLCLGERTENGRLSGATSILGWLSGLFTGVVKIRPAIESDRDAIWTIFHDVIASADTYAFDPQMPRQDALAYWFRSDTHAYVAESHGRIVGTYILRPNQLGPGSHVANAAFMVAPNAHGQGIGRAMGEHCLNEARRLGFRAMQFNFVVSTNESAIRLWQRLDFKIVGTLPDAFRHPERGYVDVHVMFRSLL
jgi:L-amino acid N-acyltransferase YncA